MRQDMYRVLTEHPRSGLRLKSSRGNRPRLSEWSGEESFAGDYRPKRQETKHFSDLISPLRRWLRTQVGRPWDKVWSELVQGVDARTLMGRHLLDHASCEVDRHCRLDIATRRPMRIDGRPVTGLYVDPRSGLLRWLEPPGRRLLRKQHRQLPAVSPDTLWLGEHRFRLKRNGIWFDVDASPQHRFTNDRSRFDFEWIGQRFTIVRQRSLNARALREAGLKNDDA